MDPFLEAMGIAPQAVTPELSEPDPFGGSGGFAPLPFEVPTPVEPEIPEQEPLFAAQAEQSLPFEQETRADPFADNISLPETPVEPAFDPYADQVSSLPPPSPIEEEEQLEQQSLTHLPSEESRTLERLGGTPQQFATPDGRSVIAVPGLTEEQLVAAEAKRESQVELERAERVADLQKEQAERDASLARARERADEQLEQNNLRRDQLLAEKVNRKTAFRDLDPAQQAGSIFAALIGGLLSPHRGGRNTGLEFVERNLDRLVQSERSDIENQLNSLAEGRGEILSNLKREHAINNEAYARYQANVIQAEDHVKGKLARLDPRGTQALRHQRALADLQAVKQKKAEEIQRYNQGVALEQDKIKQRDLASKRSTGLGFAQLKERRRDREDARQAKLAAQRQEAQLREELGLPPGVKLEKAHELSIPGIRTTAGKPVYAGTGSEASDIKDLVAGANTLTSLSREIHELTSGLSAAEKKNPTDALRARAKSLAGQAGFAYGKLNAAGAFDQGLATQLEKIQGDPSAIFANPEASISAFVTGSQTAANNKLLSINENVDLNVLPYNAPVTFDTDSGLVLQNRQESR